jgi:hypothetical protein
MNLRKGKLTYPKLLNGAPLQDLLDCIILSGGSKLVLEHRFRSTLEQSLGAVPIR